MPPGSSSPRWTPSTISHFRRQGVTASGRVPHSRSSATMPDLAEVLAAQCTASRFGDHDYSRPPHNTPDDPRGAPDKTACQAQSAAPPFGACEHERRYEVIIFQIATHDWIRLFACEIGRASCKGKSVDLGGRRIIKKKKIRVIALCWHCYYM